MVRNLVERLIGGSKDSEVGLRAVQRIDQVWVFAKSLGQLRSILALRNELIHSHIRLAMVGRVMRVVRPVMAFVERIVGIVHP